MPYLRDIYPKASVFVLVMLVASMLSAQKPRPYNLPYYDNAPYHFGFVLGINQMFFALNHSEDFQYRTFTNDESPDTNSDEATLLGIESNPNFGFNIGIVSNLRLGEYLDLRFIPSLAFGERDLSYRIESRKNSNPKWDTNYISKPIQSTFVEFPLLVRYKSLRMNNFSSYLIGGAKYSLDLISDARRQSKSNETIVKLNRNDFYLELGVGFDFYTEYFKFGTEIKMSYGLRDLLRKEGNIYTEGLNSIHSKIFILSFTFE